MILIRKPFIRALALGAALALHTAAPAHAVGPLTAEGVPAPTREQWENAVPGQNPLTTGEAAATMAFFHRCGEVGVIDPASERLNVMAFTDDIRAGGNDANDFTEGGSKVSLYQDHLKSFREIGDAYWAVACFVNPYYEFDN